MDRDKRRKQKRAAFFMPIFHVIQTISIAFSMYHYYLESMKYDHKWSVMHLLCILITLVSFSLWFLSRIQLGVHLTLLPKADGKLIQTGIYAYVRNPIYVFGTVALTSYLLLIKKTEYLLVLVVLIPLQFVRAIQERKVLRKKFGDDYDDYAKKVWI